MHTILAAVDDSPRAKHVLEVAVDLARRLGAKVWLFRAVGLPPELPTNAWTMTPTQVVDDFLLTARSSLATLAATVPSELYAGASAQVGVPWDAICSFAKEHDVGLI